MTPTAGAGVAPPHAVDILQALDATHQTLERNGVWHCVTYGILLGAVRESAPIPWDTDFDLFVRPDDVPAIVHLGGRELRFEPVTMAGAELAVGSGVVPCFDPGRLAVLWRGRKLGDLHYPITFADGVRRPYDVDQEVFWTPHRSIPDYFLQQLTGVELAGKCYPAPAEAERFLEATYGSDWHTPYRAVVHGGQGREDRTTRGEAFLPDLTDQVNWSRSRGWDDSRYADEHSWPRGIRGAGPIGPTQRTAATSRGLWWWDVDELKAQY